MNIEKQNTNIAQEAQERTERPQIEVAEGKLTIEMYGEKMELELKDDGFWCTYEQLAELWGYKDPKYVANIISRHQDEFSSLLKVKSQVIESKNGVQQKRHIKLINKTGFFLFGYHCQTERGKQFRRISAEMWTEIEKYMRKQAELRIQRELIKEQLQSGRNLRRAERAEAKEAALREDIKELASKHPAVQLIKNLEAAGIVQDIKDVKMFKSGPRVSFYPTRYLN